MKKTIVTCFLLILALTLNAQHQFRKPLRSQPQSTNLAFSNYTVGLKLGCPWSVLIDSDLTEVTYSGNIGYNLGIVIERYFSRLSVGLEGIFAQKGTKMSYDMPYQTSLTTEDVFHREFFLGYNVVSVRIPLTYYFKGTVKDDKVVPYVFVAPQVDLPLPFDATFRQGAFLFENPPSQHTLTSYGQFFEDRFEAIDTQTLLNYSALAGFGLMGRIPTDGSAIIIKFDIAANYGIRDMSDNDDIAIHSHDVEANLTVIFPIKKKLRDACYYFRK